VNLGYCGLDRGRSPLRGDEIRPCWEGPLSVVSQDSEGREGLEELPVRPPWPVDYGLFGEPDRGA
jgi:hypothetical protein